MAMTSRQYSRQQREQRANGNGHGNGHGQQAQAQAQRPENTTVALKDARSEIERMSDEFAKVLPKAVPSDAFVRVAKTALQLDPELANADRRSLIASLMKAAQDGLLPDKREGALVIYSTKVPGPKGDQWIKAVQWMPMVHGLRKLARNSGEVAYIGQPEIVYDHDHYVLELGDEPKLEHRPLLRGDRGEPLFAYCIAQLRSGEKVRAWMPMDAIEKRRAASKAAKSGPWVSWWEEMVGKTVVRRLCSVLPRSSDKDEDRLFAASARNVELDDGPEPSDLKDITPREPEPAASASDLDGFAAQTPAQAQTREPAPAPEPEPEGPEPDDHDPETGELIDPDDYPDPGPQEDDDQLPLG